MIKQETKTLSQWLGTIRGFFDACIPLIYKLVDTHDPSHYLVSATGIYPQYPFLTNQVAWLYAAVLCDRAGMTNAYESAEMWQQLRTTLKAALHDFGASTSAFKILYSIPEKPASSCATLYVLDSSFNPPSKAHALLATNALRNDKGRKPARLLLLLATTNADKAPKPAAFQDRVAMMTFMADHLYRVTGQTAIDVGVTKKPFFVDKAKSIEDSEIYGDAEQVHLVGFDTLTRILNSKYYPDDEKLGILNPFLTKHRLRVNYRLGEEYGDQDNQDEYLKGITDGSRADEGMRAEWRENIEMVNDAEDGRGVSSTEARKAVVEGHPDKLGKYVDSSVAEYVTGMKLYLDVDTEK